MALLKRALEFHYLCCPGGFFGYPAYRHNQLILSSPSPPSFSSCTGQVTVFETLGECKDALKKFFSRMQEPVIPLLLHPAAVAVGAAWRDDSVSLLDRVALLQDWYALLPTAHQTVLTFVVQHWHHLATRSTEACNAITRLAAAAAPLLVRKVQRSEKAALTRLCEALIAQPELLCTPSTMRDAVRAELARLEPERPSWQGAWPMLPPHTKAEARHIQLPNHAFIANLVGITEAAEASFV